MEWNLIFFKSIIKKLGVNLFVLLDYKIEWYFLYYNWIIKTNIFSFLMDYNLNYYSTRDITK